PRSSMTATTSAQSAMSGRAMGWDQVGGAGVALGSTDPSGTSGVVVGASGSGEPAGTIGSLDAAIAPGDSAAPAALGDGWPDAAGLAVEPQAVASTARTIRVGMAFEWAAIWADLGGPERPSRSVMPGRRPGRRRVTRVRSQLADRPPPATR